MSILNIKKARESYDRIPISDSRLNRINCPKFKPSCEKITEFWNSNKRIKFLIGANQSGKSTTGGAYVADFIRRNPNCIVWAVAINYDRTRICYEKIMEYTATDEISDIAWNSRNKGIAHNINMKNGARIDFKSADAGFLKFEGDTVNLVWIDEEIVDKQVFSSCIARTTMTHGQIIITMTPLNGKTWVYNEFIKNEHPEVFHTTITLFENPYINKERCDEMVKLYSEDEAAYRIYGKWGVLEGKIYKEFSENIHIIPFDENIIKNSKYILKALDFGRTMACLWIAIDYNNIIYVVAEIKLQEVGIEDFYNEIINVEKELEIEDYIIPTFTDHSFTERYELERKGIECILADKSIARGIAIVKRVLKVHDNNVTSFKIMDNCDETIDELEDYQYVQVRHNKELSSVPNKKNDHLMDCLRYAVVAAADNYCDNDFLIESF